MRKTTITTLVALLTLASTAAATTPAWYVPKAHHACKLRFVKRTVRVRKTRHHKRVWVRQVRCVYVAPKKTAKPNAPAPTAPAVHLIAHVDPTVTVSKTDPLTVSIDYSADATSTVNGVTTDLAATGQLPDGILELMSTYEPGGTASQLLCAINVGGNVSGGTCGPESYSGGFGTYELTTIYVVSTTNSVTDSEVMTLSPFTTTSALSSATSGTTTTYTDAVTDQNGNAVERPSPVEWVVTDQTTGRVVGTFYGRGASESFKMIPHYDPNSHQQDGQTIAIFDPGATTVTDTSDLVDSAHAFTVQAVYQPAGRIWTGSTSAAVPLVLSS